MMQILKKKDSTNATVLTLSKTDQQPKVEIQTAQVAQNQLKSKVVLHQTQNSTTLNGNHLQIFPQTVKASERIKMFKFSNRHQSGPSIQDGSTKNVRAFTKKQNISLKDKTVNAGSFTAQTQQMSNNPLQNKGNKAKIQTSSLRGGFSSQNPLDSMTRHNNNYGDTPKMNKERQISDMKRDKSGQNRQQPKVNLQTKIDFHPNRDTQKIKQNYSKGLAVSNNKRSNRLRDSKHSSSVALTATPGDQISKNDSSQGDISSICAGTNASNTNANSKQRLQSILAQQRQEQESLVKGKLSPSQTKIPFTSSLKKQIRKSGKKQINQDKNFEVGGFVDDKKSGENQSKQISDQDLFVSGGSTSIQPFSTYNQLPSENNQQIVTKKKALRIPSTQIVSKEEPSPKITFSDPNLLTSDSHCARTNTIFSQQVAHIGTLQKNERKEESQKCNNLFMVIDSQKASTQVQTVSLAQMAKTSSEGLSQQNPIIFEKTLIPSIDTNSHSSKNEDKKSHGEENALNKGEISNNLCQLRGFFAQSLDKNVGLILANKAAQRYASVDEPAQNESEIHVSFSTEQPSLLQQNNKNQSSIKQYSHHQKQRFSLGPSLQPHQTLFFEDVKSGKAPENFQRNKNDFITKTTDNCQKLITNQVDESLKHKNQIELSKHQIQILSKQDSQPLIADEFAANGGQNLKLQSTNEHFAHNIDNNFKPQEAHRNLKAEALDLQPQFLAPTQILMTSHGRNELQQFANKESSLQGNLSQVSHTVSSFRDSELLNVALSERKKAHQVRLEEQHRLLMQLTEPDKEFVLQQEKVASKTNRIKSPPKDTNFDLQEEVKKLKNRTERSEFQIALTQPLGQLIGEIQVEKDDFQTSNRKSSQPENIVKQKVEVFQSTCQNLQLKSAKIRDRSSGSKGRKMTIDKEMINYFRKIMQKDSKRMEREKSKPSQLDEQNPKTAITNKMKRQIKQRKQISSKFTQIYTSYDSNENEQKSQRVHSDERVINIVTKNSYSQKQQELSEKEDVVAKSPQVDLNMMTVRRKSDQNRMAKVDDNSADEFPLQKKQKRSIKQTLNSYQKKNLAQFSVQNQTDLQTDVVSKDLNKRTPKINMSLGNNIENPYKIVSVKMIQDYQDTGKIPKQGNVKKGQQSQTKDSQSMLVLEQKIDQILMQQQNQGQDVRIVSPRAEKQFWTNKKENQTVSEQKITNTNSFAQTVQGSSKQKDVGEDFSRHKQNLKNLLSPQNQIVSQKQLKVIRNLIENRENKLKHTITQKDLYMPPKVDPGTFGRPSTSSVEPVSDVTNQNHLFFSPEPSSKKHTASSKLLKRGKVAMQKQIPIAPESAPQKRQITRRLTSKKMSKDATEMGKIYSAGTNTGPQSNLASKRCSTSHFGVKSYTSNPTNQQKNHQQQHSSQVSSKVPSVDASKRISFTSSIVRNSPHLNDEQKHTQNSLQMIYDKQIKFLSTIDLKVGQNQQFVSDHRQSAQQQPNFSIKKSSVRKNIKQKDNLNLKSAKRNLIVVKQSAAAQGQQPLKLAKQTRQISCTDIDGQQRRKSNILGDKATKSTSQAVLLSNPPAANFNPNLDQLCSQLNRLIEKKSQKSLKHVSGGVSPQSSGSKAQLFAEKTQKVIQSSLISTNQKAVGNVSQGEKQRIGSERLINKQMASKFHKTQSQSPFSDPISTFKNQICQPGSTNLGQTYPLPHLANNAQHLNPLKISKNPKTVVQSPSSHQNKSATALLRNAIINEISKQHGSHPQRLESPPSSTNQLHPRLNTVHSGGSIDDPKDNDSQHYASPKTNQVNVVNCCFEQKSCASTNFQGTFNVGVGGGARAGKSRNIIADAYQKTSHAAPIDFGLSQSSASKIKGGEDYRQQALQVGSECGPGGGNDLQSIRQPFNLQNQKAFYVSEQQSGNFWDRNRKTTTENQQSFKSNFTGESHISSQNQPRKTKNGDVGQKKIKTSSNMTQSNSLHKSSNTLLQQMTANNNNNQHYSSQESLIRQPKQSSCYTTNLVPQQQTQIKGQKQSWLLKSDNRLIGNISVSSAQKSQKATDFAQQQFIIDVDQGVPTSKLSKQSIVSLLEKQLMSAQNLNYAKNQGANGPQGLNKKHLKAFAAGLDVTSHGTCLTLKSQKEKRDKKGRAGSSKRKKVGSSAKTSVRPISKGSSTVNLN